MEKTFIIEYHAGCKGDFLTNWLNYNKFIPHDEIATRSKVEKWQKILFNDTISLFDDKSATYLPELIDLQKKLDLSKKSKFSNSHYMFFYSEKIYKNEFKIRNIKIKKIVFEEKYYKTIFIENFFKNINVLKNQINDHLAKNKLLITEKNQVEFVYNYLSDNTNFFPKKIHLFNNHKKQNIDKDILNYEDLYITFKIKDDDLLENLNLENYRLAVEKTWLPEKIKVFNHKFDLIDMGYRSM